MRTESRDTGTRSDLTHSLILTRCTQSVNVRRRRTGILPNQAVLINREFPAGAAAENGVAPWSPHTSFCTRWHVTYCLTSMLSRTGRRCRKAWTLRSNGRKSCPQLASASRFRSTRLRSASALDPKTPAPALQFLLTATRQSTSALGRRGGTRGGARSRARLREVALRPTDC